MPGGLGFGPAHPLPSHPWCELVPEKKPPVIEQPDLSAAGAASRTEMSRLARRGVSRLGRIASSPRLRAIRHQLVELGRRMSGQPHRVLYFHEVEDPYSLLAAQAVAELSTRYDVTFECHLAGAEEWPSIPEPDLLAELGRRDCQAIAPHYGLDFPEPAERPDPDRARRVERALAQLDGADGVAFARRAAELGALLFAGRKDEIDAVPEEELASDATTEERVSAGRALRDKLGHYSGAMFLYGGEWFWGVDRLLHLVKRLRRFGATRGGSQIRFDRPAILMQRVPGADDLVLECFPSLRSPYTAIGFDATVQLAEQTGVTLEVRPVLPMVMRGVPATMAKGMYILRDTRREAPLLGAEFGRMIDPIGEPVRRAYSLWPLAQRRGCGTALISSFLRGAWSEGIDTSTDAGLRIIVERAGIPWSEAEPVLGDSAWEQEMESNRLAMVDEMGQWGVPSFRLRRKSGEVLAAHWGQDRLWLLSRDIQQHGGGKAE